MALNASLAIRQPKLLASLSLLSSRRTSYTRNQRFCGASREAAGASTISRPCAKRKDGTLFPISVTISPIRNRAGDIVGASKVRSRHHGLLTKKLQEDAIPLVPRDGASHQKPLRCRKWRRHDQRSLGHGQKRAGTHDYVPPKCACAHTQDLTLSGASTHSTTLRELVRVILAPYDAGVGHLLVEGSDLECGPRTGAVRWRFSCTSSLRTRSNLRRLVAIDRKRRSRGGTRVRRSLFTGGNLVDQRRDLPRTLNTRFRRRTRRRNRVGTRRHYRTRLAAPRLEHMPYRPTRASRVVNAGRHCWLCPVTAVFAQARAWSTSCRVRNAAMQGQPR